MCQKVYLKEGICELPLKEAGVTEVKSQWTHIPVKGDKV